MKTTAAEDDVRLAIMNLIEAGTTFDIDELERIYHQDLQVIMIDQTSDVSVANKKGFKSLFETKRAAGDDPLDTWAEFNRIDVDGDRSHVLVTRKVNLTGQDQILTLSIDLQNEDNRWQVIREVIFARPDPE